MSDNSDKLDMLSLRARSDSKFLLQNVSDSDDSSKDSSKSRNQNRLRLRRRSSTGRGSSFLPTEDSAKTYRGSERYTRETVFRLYELIKLLEHEGQTESSRRQSECLERSLKTQRSFRLYGNCNSPACALCGSRIRARQTASLLEDLRGCNEILFGVGTIAPPRPHESPEHQSHQELPHVYSNGPKTIELRQRVIRLFNENIGNVSPCWFTKWHWTNHQGDFYPHLNVVIGDLVYDKDTKKVRRVSLGPFRDDLRTEMQSAFQSNERVPHSFAEVRGSVSSIEKTVGYVCQDPNTPIIAKWRYAHNRALHRLGVLGPKTRKMWANLEK